MKDEIVTAILQEMTPVLDQEQLTRLKSVVRVQLCGYDIMGNKEFLKKSIDIVVDYFNSHADKTNQKQITEDDVFVVWYCKSLQNHKALLSTTVSDGMYYEITHNGDKQETYVDAYKKWENFVVR